MTDSSHSPGPGEHIPGGHRAVPPALRVTADWLWRLLVAAAGLWVVYRVVRLLWAVALTIAIALLLAALLKPPADWLKRHSVPDFAATWAVLGGALVGLGAVTAYIVPQFLDEIDQLQSKLVASLGDLRAWLVDGPLALRPEQVDQLRTQLIDLVQRTLSGDAGAMTAALSGALIALEVIAAILLTLVLTFFFIKDGSAMARWCLRHLGRRQREPARRMGQAAWGALSGYLRGVAILATFNAMLTAVGLTVIGVPLVLSLTVIEFALSWIPIVGSLVAGALAVLVAFVSGGLTDAVLVLGMAIMIDQIEGHFFQPVVVGHAVHLHPVVVLVVLSVGGILAGVGGALLAVPLTATIVAAIGALRAWREHDAGQAAATPAEPAAERPAQAAS